MQLSKRHTGDLWINSERGHEVSGTKGDKVRFIVKYLWAKKQPKKRKRHNNKTLT